MLARRNNIFNNLKRTLEQIERNTAQDNKDAQSWVIRGVIGEIYISLTNLEKDFPGEHARLNPLITEVSSLQPNSGGEYSKTTRDTIRAIRQQVEAIEREENPALTDAPPPPANPVKPTTRSLKEQLQEAQTKLKKTPLIKEVKPILAGLERELEQQVKKAQDKLAKAEQNIEGQDEEDAWKDEPDENVAPVQPAVAAAPDDQPAIVPPAQPAAVPLAQPAVVAPAADNQAAAAPPIANPAAEPLEHVFATHEMVENKPLEYLFEENKLDEVTYEGGVGANQPIPAAQPLDPAQPAAVPPAQPAAVPPAQPVRRKLPSIARGLAQSLDKLSKELNKASTVQKAKLKNEFLLALLKRKAELEAELSKLRAKNMQSPHTERIIEEIATTEKVIAKIGPASTANLEDPEFIHQLVDDIQEELANEKPAKKEPEKKKKYNVEQHEIGADETDEEEEADDNVIAPPAPEDKLSNLSQEYNFYLSELKRIQLQLPVDLDLGDRKNRELNHALVTIISLLEAAPHSPKIKASLIPTLEQFMSTKLSKFLEGSSSLSKIFLTDQQKRNLKELEEAAQNPNAAQEERLARHPKLSLIYNCCSSLIKNLNEQKSLAAVSTWSQSSKTIKIASGESFEDALGKSENFRRYSQGYVPLAQLQLQEPPSPSRELKLAYNVDKNQFTEHVDNENYWVESVQDNTYCSALYGLSANLRNQYENGIENQVNGQKFPPLELINLATTMLLNYWARALHGRDTPIMIDKGFNTDFVDAILLCAKTAQRPGHERECRVLITDTNFQNHTLDKSMLKTFKTSSTFESITKTLRGEPAPSISEKIKAAFTFSFTPEEVSLSRRNISRSEDILENNKPGRVR